MLNIKKIIVTVIGVFLFCPFMVGCQTNSLKSPEKLVEIPITNKDNKVIYDKIKSITSIDTTFTIPQNSDNVGRINVLDLDSDGNEEVIAFKKKQNDSQSENVVYVYIFKYENGKITDDTERIIKIPGESIKFATFSDIDNDGKKEIIMQVQNRGLENIYIYKNDRSSIKKIAEYNSAQYSIRLNSFNYASDGKDICLALLYNLDSSELSIGKMNYSEGKIHFDVKDKITNVTAFDTLDIINGNVSDNNNGSVIVYKNSNGYTYTQILTYKNGKFIKVLPDNSDLAKNTYSHKAYDIDKDGTLEIPKVEYEDVKNTSKVASIITWNEWNGLTDKEARLYPAVKVYYNYDYNFKLNFTKLKSDGFIINSNKKGISNTISFSKKIDGDSVKPIFSILIIDKHDPKFEANKYESEIKNNLFENQDYLYIYNSNDKKNLYKSNIDYKLVKDSFEMINK